MFWADRIAKQIIETGQYTPYWVDDMKTPSGRIHVGSLRGVLIHELVWRALKDAGKEVKFTYVFEDHDPMDELPPFLDRNIWGKYLGQPLFTVPSPEKGAENFARFFAVEFQNVFNKMGCLPEIIWVSDLYKSGKMNKGIKLCLNKADIIRKIYEEMYHKKLDSDWFPFQAVCPKCGKESTTRVTSWDGENISFICEVEKVPWAKGCGYKGKISPFSDRNHFAGKLPWKVEWPVKWQVIGVTIEGAGKDHMSAGGSHDIAKLICNKVLNYPVPYPIAYEFFLVGGKKMSSSKGLGSSAKEVSDLMPPYLGRFLFTRTDYKQAIEFDPVRTMAISDLFDEYDRCWREFNINGDNDLSRSFEISQIVKIPPKNRSLFLPRFRDVANYLQMADVDLSKKFSEIKGSELREEELIILKEREKYARLWLDKYAPLEFKLQMTVKLPNEAYNLSDLQKIFLKRIAQIMESEKSPEKLQLELYNISKEINLNSKDAFSAVYLAIIGKNRGPKAAWFLLQYPKDAVIKRLNDASETLKESPRKEIPLVKLNRPDIFSIDARVKKAYPTVSVGIAIIKGVTIVKENYDLEKEKKDFLITIADLTTDKLGKYPEILSYRKLYREMGIDWHSRRPSPEALLRRIALGKGLYTVNTCVDAYNLVVMKHRVSVGAFDLDEIKVPTLLRYAGEGDKILLLGDNKPTKYSDKEIAYYDKSGGYNIDFNFRDAQRTMVTEETTDLLINVDGIYDITPPMVLKSLHESVELIIKYCGGKVELAGIVL